MTIKPLFSLPLFLFALLPAASAEGWIHENSDLDADPSVVWGELENGLRYAVLPHDEPPERVSLRLLIQAGSLMEEDDQQGLAHFLEHMAFNGTKRFPGTEMVEYFQRLGMGFGADTNAHTSFDETVYKLELPENSTELLDEGLSLFRDYCDGMLLEAGEIDKERGVILSESRARDSVGWRTFKEEFKFLLPESLISRRMPIGVDEIIETMPRERFVDYYKKWYTLDRAVIIAVGDIDEARLRPALEKHFGNLKAPAEKLPDPDLGKIIEPGLTAKLHSEPEAPATTVSIQFVKPFTDGPDSKARRRYKAELGLAGAMIKRRLDILSKQEDAPFTEGSFYDWSWFEFVQFAGIELTTTPENYEAALRTAEQELRRALEHGFTQAELEEAYAKRQNALREAADSASTRKARSIAGHLVSSINDKRVFTSPAQDLALFEEEAFTVQGCHESLRRLCDAGSTYLFASGNLELENAAGKLVDIYRASRAAEVAPPVETQSEAFAYESIGERGDTVARKDLKDLEISQARLSNGVRVNLKHTDFQEKRVYVKMRFGGGLLDAADVAEGLPLLAGAIFTAGGLEAHSADELERIFAGKSVDVSFAVEEDAFALTGSTTSRDIPHLLRLMTAYLHAPGYRDEALRQAHKQFEELYKQLRHTPEGVIRNEVTRLRTGGDKRFGYPPEDVLGALTAEDVRNWLREPLRSGYLEVSIVGDMDADNTLSLCEKTVGALPGRSIDKPDFAEARMIAFPDSAQHRLSVNTEIQKAYLLGYWPTEDIWDIGRTRRLGMLASVFDDRLRKKIREEIGESYSPYATNRPSNAFTGYGYTVAVVNIQPAQAERIRGIVQELAATLSGGGITEDELERARAPLLNKLEELVRNNRYWLETVLSDSQEHPQRLDFARTIIEDNKAITVEELNGLARQYYTPDKMWSVVIVPEKHE